MSEVLVPRRPSRISLKPAVWIIAALAVALAAAIVFVIVRGPTGTAPDADWPLHGGTEQSEGYSPLDQINRDTVGRLGLAWSLDLETDRGQEATPIIADGTLYTISAYDIVRAVDARTGEVLWSYDTAFGATAAAR